MTKRQPSEHAGDPVLQILADAFASRVSQKWQPAKQHGHAAGDRSIHYIRLRKTCGVFLWPVLIVAAAWLILNPAAQGQTPPSLTSITCGGNNMEACGIGDPYYYINYSQGFFSGFTSAQCDLALAPIQQGGGLTFCEDVPLTPNPDTGGIRTIIGTTLNTPWIDFAMKQQRYAIQSDQAMNWISVLGTHNSFSNYQDGAFDAGINGVFTFNFNVDQYYSMSDQLDAGARMIRLDPISSGDQLLRMCHQSFDSASAISWACSLTSYGRLFAYGINEVQDWLYRNPDEVLVMRLNRVQYSDIPQIDQVIEDSLEKVGIGVLHVPGSGYADAWNPDNKGWPTMREMRAMNKSLIILSDNGTPKFSYPWGYVAPDGYTDALNGDGTKRFIACEDQNGVDVRTRDFRLWSYIGEDRSGSNAISHVDDFVAGTGTTGGAGLLKPGDVRTVTNCGFGLVNVDFLLAGSYAPHLDHKVDLQDHGLGNFKIDAFDYRFGSDKRREEAIWSWDEGDMGQEGPAYLKSNGRWGSISADNSMRFACAIGESNARSPVDYQWVLSDVRGTWIDGPSACKAVGGQFWAPQSPLENEHLKAVASQEPVWINYTAVNEKLVLEPVSPRVEAGSTPTQFVLNVKQGESGLALNTVFQYTGGIGGAIVAKLYPHGIPVFDSRIHVDTRAKSIYFYAGAGSMDSHGKISLPAGTYYVDFSVDEQRNGNYPVGSGYILKVNVIPSTVNVTVGSSIPGQTVFVDGNPITTPMVFSWVSGSQHKLDASKLPIQQGTKWVFQKWSDGATGIERMYTAPGGNSTIEPVFNEFFRLTLIPNANGSFVVHPPSHDGFYLAGTPITIAALPHAGYQFKGFTGTLSGTANPLVTNVSEPLVIGGTFVPLH